MQKLQKCLNLIEIDISGHLSQIESLNAQAEMLYGKSHFNAATIKERQEVLIESYKELKVPLKRQKERLEASHQLQQFFRDMEDECAWIKEQESLVSSTNTGS